MLNDTMLVATPSACRVACSLPQARRAQTDTAEPYTCAHELCQCTDVSSDAMFSDLPCRYEASPQQLQSHHLPHHCTASPPLSAAASPTTSGPGYAPCPPPPIASSTIRQLVQAFVQNLMQVRTWPLLHSPHVLSLGVLLPSWAVGMAPAVMTAPYHTDLSPTAQYVYQHGLSVVTERA